MERKYLCFWALAVMLLCGIQQVKADDNQPRFMIPTADITDGGIGGVAAICEKNPYFTIYLWTRNVDHKDSYWESEPTLTVDGHSVKLTGLKGNNGFGDGIGNFVCYDSKKVYYYVRSRGGFMAGDNNTFTNIFPDLKKKSNWDQDYYIPLDIIMYENHNTAEGETHKVSVRGKAKLDKTTKDIDVKDLNDKTELTNQKTVCPFIYSAANSSLEWTAPDTLSFTSCDFSTQNWGRYRVALDDQVSELKLNGPITVKKGYSNPNYSSSDSKKVEYRYGGVYDFSNPTARHDGPVTKLIWNGGWMYGWWGAYTFPESVGNARLYMSYDKTVRTDGNMYIDNDNTKLTIKCLNSRILKARILNSNIEVCKASQEDNPQYTLVMTLPQCNFNYYEVTFEDNVDYLPVFFSETNDRSPKTLPYPSNLTADTNPWSKQLTLYWDFNNVNTATMNYEGTFTIYRDNQKINTVSSSFTSTYKFVDNDASYDTDHKYSVTWTPKGWSDGTKAGEATGTFRISHTPLLDELQIATLSDGYKLNWKLKTKLQTRDYTFKVYRLKTTSNHNPSANEFKEENLISTVSVSDINQLDYSYTDKAVNSSSTYAYLVTLAAQQTTYLAGPTIPTGHPDGSQLMGMTASRGTFTDKVVVKWNTDVRGEDRIDFILYRHEIKVGENTVTTLAQAEQLDWKEVMRITDSRDKEVTYEDKDVQCGSYYAYAVVAKAHDDDNVFNRMAADGFARSTGMVYGTVTYEGNRFAVEGVKVAAQASDEAGRSQFNALSFDGNGSLSWTVDSLKMATYFRARPFSVQFYVNPSTGQDGACLLDMDGVLQLSLAEWAEATGTTGNSGGYKLKAKIGDNTYTSTLRIGAKCYTSVTLTTDGSGNAMLYVMAPDSLGRIASEQLVQGASISWPMSHTSTVSLGATAKKSGGLKGYIDDVRFFNRQLTKADVEQNFNHLMGGKESGLVAYWTFDEGISTLRHAYDYSMTGTTPNDNYASIEGGVRTKNEIPSPDQLALFAVTDTLGQYTVQGIPFTDKGSTYNIIPTKGAHDFDPVMGTIYFSPMTSLSVPMNFEDNSSFDVKGVVYYENTTYPVKGCRFRVDNTVVKDEWGNEIVSDENGEFTIPVSIGQHVIYIEKDGHTFLNGGRYPATGQYNFNNTVSDLTFTDQTLVTVVGRVAGGTQQKNKPLGWGESTATIGAATLTLLTSSTIEDSRRMNVYLDSISGKFMSCDSARYFEQASEHVNSPAWVDGTSAGTDGVKRITIKTDPVSGEFAVKLPPVPYYISTSVDNNPTATAWLDSNVMLDASNVLKKDSTVVDGVTFYYNASFVQTYIATPTISVVQDDLPEGIYGEEKMGATKANGDIERVEVYNVDSLGHVNYNYGYPIFEYAGTYTFDIASYESYVNYDGPQPVEFRQPTEGVVTINNMMTLGTDTANVAKLDSLGHYQYTFQVLNPNIEDPYTRPIDITVGIGDNVYPWYYDEEESLPLRGIVFGAVLTGNNFVTKAPDRLINILRDPFGSSSKLTWKDNSTKSISYKLNSNFSIGVATNEEGSGGVENVTGTGVPGCVVMSNSKVTYSRGLGMDVAITLGRNQVMTWKTTTTKTFATSGSAIYDGPMGDVFIACSTALSYGDGKQVQFINNQKGGWYVGTDDAIVVSDSIGTDFAYSQYYIENELLPNYKKMRNDLLQTVSESELQTYLGSYVNNSEKTIYMTTRHPSDANFGDYNDSTTVKTDSVKHITYGDSYAVFWPTQAKKPVEDEVQNYNEQIRLWKQNLAYNEEQKVKAIRSGSPEFTYSFDTGSPINYTSDDTFNFSEAGTLQTSDKQFKKLGFLAEGSGAALYNKQTGFFQLNLAYIRQPGISYDKSESDTYIIDLSDNVNDNSHVVSVYEAPDDFSRIFVQTGGQTSRIYEAEQRTKYYEPGQHIISQGTVQIETPHISCDKTVISGVPQGQPAVFNLKLTNPTAATVVQRIQFDLGVTNDKWAKKAIITANGAPLDGGIYPVLLAPKDSALVALSVTPASADIFHIDSLHVSFYSDGQKTISDNIILAAHFLPQAEPIQLAASRKLVNTATDSTLTLKASGYNVNSTILNGVRLQQRKQGAPEWTTIRSYVRSNPAGDTESLLKAEGVDTLIDMHSSIFYPDATYEFRAVTDCTVGEETVLGESETITVIKDVTLPKPIELPEPADGVLSEGDNITVTFNEDIYSQSLNKPDNFVIQSVLNTDSVAHDVALLLDGSDTPAATSQSKLTLSGTSFTLCSWVKSSGTAGTLFRHGEGRNAFCVDIDAEGYLSAAIKDENGQAHTYKASIPLEKDIWEYVAVVYNLDKGTLSAYSASGDNEEILMSDVAVGKNASSDGNIYLGEGLTGAMHELSLFSAPLTWTTIKAQMYLGKSNSTPKLIGYWRLDEGHGTASEDRARSRHMQLAEGNRWYMENENISMELDGTHCAAIPLGQLSVNEGVSYLVELWVLADENQPAGAQILSLDNGQKLDLNIVGNQLQLVADSVAYSTPLSTLNFNNHQWHHVAIDVLKGGSGQANLLVDGVNVLGVSSDKVPALAGARLWLGRNMKGLVDEVRLWHGTNTQQTINERMYHRMDATKEKGLVGYWPMERTHYDEYNQRVFEFSLDNSGYEATAATALVPDSVGVAMQQGSSAPGLKMAPHKSNLDFSFVADERTVSLTLDHSAEALEGCTVSTTLRDYYDLHTNVGNPITWSFVVKQNTLSWNTSEVSTSVEAGQSGTFKATLTNNGESDQTWAFSELPSWLSASPADGTVFAHGSQEVIFTVASGNAIGKYFATVSAKGNKGIDTPLDVCLSVESKHPDWAVAPGYNESMTVIAQLKFNGILSTDPDDMIGAFTSPEGDDFGDCVGVGHPTYNASRDAYFVNLMVFGKGGTTTPDTIRFRLYDASTGDVYPLTSVSTPVIFSVDGSVGSYSAPVIVENLDKLLQTVELDKGINWMSLYLLSDKQDAKSLFDMVKKETASVEFADGRTIVYDGISWSDNHGAGVGEMMKVNMNDKAKLLVVGEAVNPADYPITVNPGNNWIGVPSATYMTVEEAFAGLSPEDGDKVKSQTAFKIYENGKWEGDDMDIEPGQGYIYTSESDKPKQFTFPASNPARKGIRRWGGQGIAANFLYANNMAMICAVHNDNGEPVRVNSIEVYDEMGNLRGKMTKMFRDSLMLFIVSGKTDGEPLILRANADDGNDGVYTALLNFKRDHYLGTLRNPFVISSSTTTDISALTFAGDSHLEVYSTAGLLMYQGRAAQFDKKRLSLNGIYIVRETTRNGQVRTYKAKTRTE